jgi:hypothetical protein
MKVYLFDGLVVENDQSKEFSLEFFVNFAVFFGDPLGARDRRLLFRYDCLHA